MNVTTVALKLVNARKQIETCLAGEGKQQRHTGTDCYIFMKELCVLIPSDLLLATNIFWSPNILCGGDAAKLKRYHDVASMLQRVSLWYDVKLPTQDGTNDDQIAVLLSLKEWFMALRVATKEHIKSITPTSVPSNSNSSSCCSCHCSTSSGSTECCEICAYCSLYSCYSCARCLVAVEKQFHINKGIEAGVSGGGYTGGGTGVFTGELEGYLSASSNAQCHACCKETCGDDFANICCFCVQVDKGTAASLTGDSTPSNCCGQLGFHSANCITDFRNCYCSCFDELFKLCFTCGSGCINVITGLFSGMSKLLQGFLQMLCNGNLCHDIGHLCDIDCSWLGSKFHIMYIFY